MCALDLLLQLEVCLAQHSAAELLRLMAICQSHREKEQPRAATKDREDQRTDCVLSGSLKMLPIPKRSHPGFRHSHEDFSSPMRAKCQAANRASHHNNKTQRLLDALLLL